jgi:hypothetical protein
MRLRETWLHFLRNCLNTSSPVAIFICTTGCNIKKLYFRLVLFQKYISVISLNSTSRLFFVMGTECVLCEAERNCCIKFRYTSVFKVLMQEFCKKLKSQIYNSRLYLSAYAILQRAAASSAINQPTLPTRRRE